LRFQESPENSGLFFLPQPNLNCYIEMSAQTLKNTYPDNSQNYRRLYRELLNACQHIQIDSHRALIKKAFIEGLSHYRDAKNLHGEFKLVHEVAVARIIAGELALDTDSIVSALLFHIPLETPEKQQEYARIFGKDTVNIITKLSQVSRIRMDKIAIMPENFIQLLLSVSGDVRVILIKLADRVSLMRHIQLLPPDEQKQVALETSGLYAPLAHRLGLYKVKSELEDLAMKYLLPEVYQGLAKKILDTADEQKKYFERFIKPIRSGLTGAGLDYEIKARTKAIPSIYLKMKKQGIEFDEVYDYFAIRIILNSQAENEKADCWKAYSHVTDIYPPNTSRLRDWISAPRPNGYESLHVTVEDPAGHSVEVQIRTRRMDETAEKGMAAHWKYKEQKGMRSSLDEWLGKIRSMLENVNAGDGDIARAAGLKVESDHIFVFTPDGHLRRLRSGATVLDFAFDVHTEIGQRCSGAKVNNLFVPLKHVLKTGDQVEITTSRNQKPNIDWLNFATTPRALSKIKRILKDAEFSEADAGKDLLMRKLGQLKIDYNDDIGNKLVLFYKAGSALDLYHGLAQGKYDIQKIKEAFQPVTRTEENKTALKPFTRNVSQPDKKSRQIPLVIINDSTPMTDVKFARCCQPVFGDEIFGFVTVTEGLKIHRNTCTNAVQMLERYSYRIVRARWADSVEKTSYVATIRVGGTDLPGILSDITNAVSGELKANIRSVNLNSRNGRFDGSLMVNVDSRAHLNLIIGRLLKIKGIKKVEREN
jgi:GTP diphosphokinase / guanosine-3',5'-bis(diphosphate) 3'-diphosphatase